MYLLCSDWIVHNYTSRVQGDNQISSANYEWFIVFLNILIVCMQVGIQKPLLMNIGGVKTTKIVITVFARKYLQKLPVICLT